MSARLTAASLALSVQLGLGLVTVGLFGCKPPAPPVQPGDKNEGGQPPATPPMSVGTPAPLDTSVPPEGPLAGEVLEPVPGTPPQKPLDKPILPPVAPEAAPAPSPRQVTAADAAQLGGRIQSFFAGQIGRRIYLQVDKPLYKPGETLWVKAWNLAARNLAEDPTLAGMWVELVSPKGAVVVKQRVRAQHGVVQTGIDLSAGLAGGEYTLRVRGLTGTGVAGERPVILSSYEPPRLKLKLEFVRKAYGAGDEVTATFEARRPTGEPLANRTLSALVRVDGVDLPRVPVTTDEAGDGLVRFQLPTEIAVGDGLLTVLADDGGLTESIAKRVPIIVNHMRFAAFPEGGALVEGLPSRVYFEARTPLNKPADVSGRVVDDQGVSVAKFESVRDGLGRVEFTPARGRTYHTEIDRPVGVTERYPLPPPMIEGCVLRTYDDLDGQTPELRAAVRCSQPRKVTLVAALRERVIDAATVAVEKDTPSIVYLQPPPQDATAQALARAQGVARLTLFDEAQRPLAERLVYRNRRARLGIKVEPDRPDYAPRDQVSLTVTTTDPQGAPVPASLALSVVDDTVLSFADDKTGHMLSRLYLEPELPGKLEEPNFYF